MGKQTAIPSKQVPTNEKTGFRRTAGYYLTHHLVKGLARTGISPDFLTWTGFLITLGAGALIITEHFFAAGFTVLAAAFFDMLDGALARTTDRVTKFGAVLDSTLDRLSESALLLSLMIVYASDGSIPGVALVGLALIFSLMVSYIRARAEGIGLECTVGIFTRTERVVVLVLGLLLSQIEYALIIALGIIVAFSFITTIQRVLHVRRQLS